MNRLRHLVREAGVALDIYLASRTAQDFSRAAFILCDDCGELAGKLFLSSEKGWSDESSPGRFKNFRVITKEVRDKIVKDRPECAAQASILTSRLEERRSRRNGFFHSANLLDLTLHARDCVEALTDMLDYGALLFPPTPAQPGNDWVSHVEATANMSTAEAILRLDRRAYSEPAIGPRLTALLANERRVGQPQKTKGCAVAHHPDDHHLRLAIRDGGRSLRDRLRLLLDAQ